MNIYLESNQVQPYLWKHITDTKWLITIWRREFSDNIGRKTYTSVFEGEHCDAVATAKLMVVYKDEWFTIEPF